jgi:hypothetical protein
MQLCGHTLGAVWMGELSNDQSCAVGLEKRNIEQIGVSNGKHHAIALLPVFDQLARKPPRGAITPKEGYLPQVLWNLRSNARPNRRRMLFMARFMILIGL